MMRLIRELALYEKAPNEVVATEQTLLSHGFGENPLFVSWVAELDGHIVGMALCYIRYSTWKGPVLYLEDLVVTESHRSKGIGKLLFETCLDYAKTQGYPRMIWQVLDWNQPAIEFYNQYQASFDAQWLNAYIDF
ncbi:MAG: GNAT family N-acetyltransferase [Bacteroidetes bacterium]|jgi:GNAT superfamily N-acetyltransferase|nr:GNAT family N-acetyltransferase [Bacteroidota bacterium]